MEIPEKRPKVKILMGRVISLTTGRIIRLARVKTTAAASRLCKSGTIKLSSSLFRIQMAALLIIKVLRITFILERM